MVLYENIDQILHNKSHGPMQYTIGFTCVYMYGHMFYSLWNEFTSDCLGQCLYTIT